MLHPKYLAPVGGLTQQRELREKINSVFYEGRVIPAHTQYEHFYKDKEDGEVYPSVTTVLNVINKPHLKQWAVNRTVEYILNWAVKMPLINKIDLYEVLEKSKTSHKERLEEAGIWGTQGHNIVDKYVDLWINDATKPTVSILDLAAPDISNEGKCAALGAEKFFNTYTLFPIVSEKKILSKKHRVGGTLDSLWLIGEQYKDRVGDTDCEHEWLERTNGNIYCCKCNREEELSIILIDLKTSNQITSVDYAQQVAAYSAIVNEMCGIKPKKHWILQLNKLKPDYTVGYIEDIKVHAKAFLHAKELSNYVRAQIEPVKMLKVKNVIVL